MSIPFERLEQKDFEDLCRMACATLGFTNRSFIDGCCFGSRWINGERWTDLLPGVSYEERWVCVPVSPARGAVGVHDLEALKEWADEPENHADYLLLLCAGTLTRQAEEWVTRLNKFPIPKYKMKQLTRRELEQVIIADEHIQKRFFPDDEITICEETIAETSDVLIRRLLNFRRDIGIIDFALVMLRSLPGETQRYVINRVVQSFVSCQLEPLKRWNAGWALSRIAKMMPEMLPVDPIVDCLVSEDSLAVRAAGAHVLAWLAESAPQMVPIDLLARMVDPAEDYFVYAPSLKALRSLFEQRDEALEVLVAMARSDDAERRFLAARTIRRLSEENPMLVPSSIVELLQNDENLHVKGEAEAIGSHMEQWWEAPLKKSMEEALTAFEERKYKRAHELFISIVAKADGEMRGRARWWAGYALYQAKDFAFAAELFAELRDGVPPYGTAAASWWESLCVERCGDVGRAVVLCQEAGERARSGEATIVGPNAEVTGESFVRLVEKRLRELDTGALAS